MTTRRAGLEQLKEWGLASWSIVGTLVLFAAIIWTVQAVAVVWPPLVLATAVIYLLAPLVDIFQRWKIHRVIGSCLAYLLFAGLIVLLGFIVVPIIQSQIVEFAGEIPQVVEDVTVFLADLAIRFGIDLAAPTAQTIQDWALSSFDTQQIEQILGQFGQFAKTGAQVLSIFLIGPVLGFYILMDLPGIRRRTRELVPESWRAEAVHVTVQVGKVVGGFVRGQLLVALIVGILSSIGLALLGVPFWLVIGMTAGLLNIVPFIGPFVGGALAAIVSLVFKDVATAFWSVAMFTAVQQFDNHVISPNVLRSRVQLHPVFILLALMLGASLGGFFGLLIAVPVAAVFKVVAGHLWRTRVLGESWEEAAEAIAIPYQPPEREGPGLVERIRRMTEDEPDDTSGSGDG